MFDFRYHALSLVAVFLALGIGILLGVTIGDPLVSSARRDLRSSLGQDLAQARRDARQSADQVDRRDQVIAQALPQLVAGRLRGERVALVSSGSLPQALESSLRRAVEMAGGTVDSVSTLDPDSTPGDVGDALGGRFSQAGSDASLLEPLGRRLGRTITRGGGPARALERALPDQFRGSFRGADAVALYRSAPDQGDGQPSGGSRADAANRETLEDSVIAGMRGAGVPMVGVEDFDSDPSQVPFYQDHELTSVDSVDLPGGQLALVYALDGAQGTFGFKSTADRALPDLGASGR